MTQKTAWFLLQRIREACQREQFKDAVRRLLLKKPVQSEISEDYEPTDEDLKQVFKVESRPKSEQGE